MFTNGFVDALSTLQGFTDVHNGRGVRASLNERLVAKMTALGVYTVGGFISRKAELLERGLTPFEVETITQFAVLVCPAAAHRVTDVFEGNFGGKVALPPGTIKKLHAVGVFTFADYVLLDRVEALKHPGFGHSIFRRCDVFVNENVGRPVIGRVRTTAPE